MAKEFIDYILGAKNKTVRAFAELDRDLTRAHRKSEKAAKGLKGMNKGLDESSGSLDKMQGKTALTSGQLAAFKGALGVATVSLGILVAALTRFVQEASLAVGRSLEFGAELGKLSAIIGVAGQQLKYLERETFKYAKQGVKVDLVAVAYRQVGSVLPELLKDVKELNRVTADVVLLNQAAGDELLTVAQSADLVGSIIKQFGLDVGDSREVVNALAAAVRAGSGDYKYLMDGILKSGKAAKLVGVSYLDLVAMLETVKEGFKEGGEAGTALKNVFLEGVIKTKRYNIETLGLSQAMRNLTKDQLGTKEMTEKFGKEALTAAAILADNEVQFKKLRKEIEGTDEATKQVSARMNNLAGDMKKLAASVDTVRVVLGREFEEELRGVTKSLEEFFSPEGAEIWAKSLHIWITQVQIAILGLGLTVLKIQGDMVLTAAILTRNMLPGLEQAGAAVSATTKLTESTIARLTKRARDLHTALAGIKQPQFENPSDTGNTPAPQYSKGVGKAAADFEKLRKQVIDIREEIARLAAVASSSATSYITTLTAGPKAAVEALSKLSDTMRTAAAVAKKHSTETKGYFDDMADGIVSAIDRFADSGFKRFDEFFKDLARLFLKQQLTKWFLALIGGGTGTTGTAAPIGKRAAGGPVSGKKPYLVGEKGPEIIVPSGNGTVIPNHRLGSGGDVVIHQTITVAGNGDATDIGREAYAGAKLAIAEQNLLNRQGRSGTRLDRSSRR